MKTLQLSRTYWGFTDKEELEEKIFKYLDETFEWNYKTEDWAIGGLPRWTFSGLPNGDILTGHVQDAIEELEIGQMSFSDEEGRIDQLKRYAHEIAESIELGSSTEYIESRES